MLRDYPEKKKPKCHNCGGVHPVASITIKPSDLKGTAATIDTNDSVLDAVPEALSTTYISATEGFKLGYGSDIEAEGAEGKAKNAVMSMPTVKIVTQRVREPNSRTAHSTPQKSSNGTDPGSAPPPTPRAELFLSPNLGHANCLPQWPTFAPFYTQKEQCKKLPFFERVFSRPMKLGVQNTLSTLLLHDD